MDIEFLSNKTVLYVEDHEETQEKIYKLLKNVFKNVLTASNGQDGLKLFNENKKDINLIISDINMPTISGLEMLERIRNSKDKTPIIFTSAYSDSNYLLEAIGLNVSGYIVKPFKIHDLINKSEEVLKEFCHIKKVKDESVKLKGYTDIIDKAAAISKTNLEGKITFANELFCQTSGFSKEELLGNSHNLIRHPEMANSIFDEMWEALQRGDSWNGKIKNRSKTGETYIFNSTIYPNFDEFGDIVEYVGVRFLITEEENEKREFKKKILNSIRESKIKEKKYIDDLKKYESSLSELKTFIKMKSKTASQEREKILKQHGQILYYEKEIKQIKEELYNSKKGSNEKIFKLYDKLKDLKESYDKAKIENDELVEEINVRREQVEKLNEQVIEQSKVIVDLRDVIEHRESQLAKFRKY